MGRRHEILENRSFIHSFISCFLFNHDEDDDTILEFGQELQQDFTALDFRDHPVQGS